MIRLLSRSPILTLIFPLEKTSYDKPMSQTIKPLNDELSWDRVKRIFTIDENGWYRKEIQSIINITLCGFATGLCMGGIVAMKNAVETFIANNEASQFISHFDAKRNLQDKVILNFLKKGTKVGLKIGLFCLIFSSVTTCTTAYRGKLAVENYMLGGSVTGFLFKINLGLRGMLVGTGLGGILGGLCGTTSIIILKLSGVTIDEILEAQQQWINSRNEAREKIHTV
ncbi:RPII140-upstream gene protein isoform X1 [Pogonomyrmex barbatus]|uniref:Complex I assembly factor TIMMDC1, mitochondrial n=1 Tax=Pogonomyrmex barbatus TaxID=144034 RepID=A0A6I9X4N5_9HYME|nr:RPII140-upstream gene protein isoform X1 [Pogonomyrmex barbatus]XP_011647645.1 RPII140-upstream gene protein isoform X1 [Pogonomyrmex barbatus]